MNMIESLWNGVRLARPSGERSDGHTNWWQPSITGFHTPLFLLTSRNPHGASLLWSSRLLWEACIKLWFPLISHSSYSSSSVIDIHTWAKIFKRQEDREVRITSHTRLSFPCSFCFPPKCQIIFFCVYFTLYSFGFFLILCGMVINNIKQKFLFTWF